MNHELNNHLERLGVPVIVKREEQMPYHVTLQGARYGKCYSTLPEYDITNLLPKIYDIVSELSDRMGSGWTGKNSFLQTSRMMVAHGPYFAMKGTLHAGKEAA